MSYICENCGKEFTEDYRKPSKFSKKHLPRFCSVRCAKQYAKHFTVDKKKIVCCRQCGVPVEVGVSSNLHSILCNSCKKKAYQAKKVQYKFPETSEIGKFERSQMYKQKSNNLKKLGFDFNKPLEEEFLRIKNIIYKHYWEEQGSYYTIMKEYSIPSTRTLYSLLDNFSIPKRSLSEAGRVAIAAGRLTQPSTDEMRSEFHHGRYINKQGEECYLRSDLEFKFAERLDKYNIPFKSEVQIEYFDSQTGGIRNGFPDFYLPDYNLYVEMKGSWLLDEINQEDRWGAISKRRGNYIVVSCNTINNKHSVAQLIEHYSSKKDKLKIKSFLKKLED